MLTLEFDARLLGVFGLVGGSQLRQEVPPYVRLLGDTSQDVVPSSAVVDQLVSAIIQSSECT